MNEANRDNKSEQQEPKPAESTDLSVIEKESKEEAFSIPCTECGAFLPISENNEFVCDACNSVQVLDDEGSLTATGEKREKKKSDNKIAGVGNSSKMPSWMWVVVGIAVAGAILYFIKRRR